MKYIVLHTFHQYHKILLSKMSRDRLKDYLIYLEVDRAKKKKKKGDHLHLQPSQHLFL